MNEWEDLQGSLRDMVRNIHHRNEKFELQAKEITRNVHERNQRFGKQVETIRTNGTKYTPSKNYDLERRKNTLYEKKCT